jgi:hypothetical protein
MFDGRQTSILTCALHGAVIVDVTGVLKFAANWVLT